MPESIKERLQAKCYGEYSSAIYAGVYHYAKCHKCDKTAMLSDVTEFAYLCACAIRDAQFFTPEVKPSQVVRNICDLLLIDHALAEIALGCRF